LPGGNLDIVSDEKVVEVAGDEPGGGRLLDDDIDDVFAVEVAGMAQECLLLFIMVIWNIPKTPRQLAEGK
jgi:hypothetical protein